MKLELSRRVTLVRQLTDFIAIEFRPEPVWEWLAGLAEHYREWHPDHVSAVWERGKANQVAMRFRPPYLD